MASDDAKLPGRGPKPNWERTRDTRKKHSLTSINIKKVDVALLDAMCARTGMPRLQELHECFMVRNILLDLGLNAELLVKFITEGAPVAAHNDDEMPRGDGSPSPTPSHDADYNRAPVHSEPNPEHSQIDRLPVQVKSRKTKFSSSPGQSSLDL